MSTVELARTFDGQITNMTGSVELTLPDTAELQSVLRQRMRLFPARDLPRRCRKCDKPIKNSERTW